MNAKSLPDRHPHFCTSITRLLRQLQDSLHEAHGRAPTYREMAEWTGVAEGTIKYWFANKGQPTAQFIVQLLERTNPKTRHEILDAACRAWPTLGHPRLQADATVISRMRTALAQPRGLVVIQGGSDESRTFLLSALGHTYLSQAERPRWVAGIDVHEPDWFVPVTGVHYLPNLFGPEQLRLTVGKLWPELQPAQRTLFLFNGIWSACADYEHKIRTLTAQFLVIFAEAGLIKPSLLRKMSKGPIEVITMSKGVAISQNLSLTVQSV